MPKPCHARAGRRSLVVRKGDDSVLLEVWGGGRLLKELSVPAAVHGAVYNDGWFASGADWSADESRVAYVAEVGCSSRAERLECRPGAGAGKSSGSCS